ncbi:uncharacterized protein M6B38_384185 [Iris pallida]|uniref:Uncharacterized protein n=1 Tax=Iris pallida TaxID=29817 RepID=A0AAX6G4S2_IRIPA|nr:uncharacterized protein M6B38_384185 [Iris pallida]
MSRARIVVFPIKGRNWCFVRSFDSASAHRSSSSPPPQLKDLWTTITSDGRSVKDNAETVSDFVAEKMSRAWSGLEKAPEGSFKSKLHRFLGVRLLSRVKPSEIFLKSVSEDVKKVEITYPASLNPRLVRRRLRHIAMRGSADHKKYFMVQSLCFPPRQLLVFCHCRIYHSFGSYSEHILIGEHSRAVNDFCY